jgi:hypothetical protein
VQGATRDATALCKHRNAFAPHCIARTKISKGSTSRFKETPVPQPLLSSSYSARCNDAKFNQIDRAIENGASTTLSRDFWQQKYFRENSLFARSPLATANFFGRF